MEGCGNEFMCVKALIIAPNDNVAVMLNEAAEGIEVHTSLGTIISKEAIPVGHKICIKEIPCGSDVIKYGLPIGRAICDIPVGSWVHLHNVEDTTEDICNAYIAAYYTKIREGCIP